MNIHGYKLKIQEVKQERKELIEREKNKFILREKLKGFAGKISHFKREIELLRVERKVIQKRKGGKR